MDEVSGAGHIYPRAILWKTHAVLRRWGGWALPLGTAALPGYRTLVEDVYGDLPTPPARLNTAAEAEYQQQLLAIKFGSMVVVPESHRGPSRLTKVTPPEVLDPIRYAAVTDPGGNLIRLFTDMSSVEAGCGGGCGGCAQSQGCSGSHSHDRPAEAARVARVDRGLLTGRRPLCRGGLPGPGPGAHRTLRPVAHASLPFPSGPRRCLTPGLPGARPGAPGRRSDPWWL